MGGGPGGPLQRWIELAPRRRNRFAKRGFPMPDRKIELDVATLGTEDTAEMTAKFVKWVPTLREKCGQSFAHSTRSGVQAPDQVDQDRRCQAEKDEAVGGQHSR